MMMMMMTYNDNIAKRLIDTYTTSIYIYLYCMHYVHFFVVHVYLHLNKCIQIHKAWTHCI